MCQTCSGGSATPGSTSSAAAACSSTAQPPPAPTGSATVAHVPPRAGVGAWPAPPPPSSGRSTRCLFRSGRGCSPLLRPQRRRSAGSVWVGGCRRRRCKSRGGRGATACGRRRGQGETTVSLFFRVRRPPDRPAR
ncbi:hypothetical protein BRADI_1g22425v3 [Brachypodium distachyon]|uniref:Uncharacterized protein n=1 Tax=Brachypodium distachyon TaxID=15368 RepID=A0A2K2DKL5_BRADI|nr:hypothetical protein BRADI_1g22425v3 [Brachypodium distachyon]